MTDFDPGAWDDDLRALLRQEANAEGIPADARRRLRKRIGAGLLGSAVAATAGKAAGATLLGGLWSKELGTVALWVALGAAGGAAVATGRAMVGRLADPGPGSAAPLVEPSQRADSMEQRTPSASPESATATRTGGADQRVAPSSSRKTPHGPALPPVSERGAPRNAPTASLRLEDEPPPAGRDRGLAWERRLLEDARREMSQARYDGALVALGRHANQFPAGRLAPERQALEIRALIGAGRYPEARLKGEAFIARDPQSVFRPTIESALGSIPVTKRP